jgi:hypothetical protein
MTASDLNEGGSSADADTQPATVKPVVSGHTPGPWDYVPANEHHGPYVTTDYGSTVADLYMLSKPRPWETDQTPKPIHFLHEMADANARLIAAAPEMLEALKDAEAGLSFAGADVVVPEGTFVPTPTLALRAVRAAIAKATTAPETVSVGMEGEARNAPNSPPSRATGEA